MTGTPVDTQFQNFIAQCEALLAQKGEDQRHACVCGLIGVPARVYEDERMTVQQVLAPHKEAGLFEIEMWYDRVNRPHSTNPVVMREPNGNLFRVHGEWTLLADHAAAKAGELEQ